MQLCPACPVGPVYPVGPIGNRLSQLWHPLQITDLRMAQVHNRRHHPRRILPQPILNHLQDLPGPHQIVRGLLVGFVVGHAIVERGVMEHQVLLDHRSQAMLQLPVR